MPVPSLERAYASNQSGVVVGVVFQHSSFSGGEIRYTIAREELTLNGVVYQPASMAIQRPARTTEGSQQLTISISNADNSAYKIMSSVIEANRVSSEKVNIIFREFLDSDLSTMVNEVQGMHVSSVSANRNVVSLGCTYTPLPANKYPPNRYYANKYPALKYANR